MVKKVFPLFLFSLVFLFSRAFSVELCARPDRNYTLTITPYAWLMDLKGTAGARGYTAHIDAPFTTTSKHINFAAMAAVDGMYKNRFGLTANLNLAMLGSHDSVQGVSLGGSSSMLMSDVACVYRIFSKPLFPFGNGKVDVDLLGGVRVWRSGLSLDVETGSHRTLEYKQNKAWVDPLIGARVLVGVTERTSLRFRVGYGGFSAASKKTWDASALLGIKVNDRVSVLAGYRSVSVDYSKVDGVDKFIFDVSLRGPIVGAILTF